MLNVITNLSTLRRHNSTYVNFPMNPQHPLQTCQLYCTPPNPSDKFPNLSAWGQWQTYQAPEECYTPVSGQNSRLAHCKPVKPWDYSKPVILEENYNPASPFTQLQPYQTLEYQFTHVPAPFRPLQPCQPQKKTLQTYLLALYLSKHQLHTCQTLEPSQICSTPSTLYRTQNKPVKIDCKPVYPFRTPITHL